LRRIVGVLTLIVLGSNAAGAQICLGRPSLAAWSANTSVRADRREGASGFGIGASAGADRAFGGVSASRLRYAELDANVTAVAASAGWSVVPSISTLYVCPILQAAYGRGPNDEATNTTRSSLSALAGLAVAGQIAVTSRVSLIPNVSAGVLVQRSSQSTDGASSAGSDIGGTVSGGVSVLLNQRLAIQPTVRVPVGFTDREPVYSLGVTIGFRRTAP
jgi:hypothetical protein